MCENIVDLRKGGVLTLSDNEIEFNFGRVAQISSDLGFPTGLVRQIEIIMNVTRISQGRYEETTRALITDIGDTFGGGDTIDLRAANVTQITYTSDRGCTLIIESRRPPQRLKDLVKERLMTPNLSDLLNG